MYISLPQCEINHVCSFDVHKNVCLSCLSYNIVNYKIQYSLMLGQLQDYISACLIFELKDEQVCFQLIIY